MAVRSFLRFKKKGQPDGMADGWLVAGLGNPGSKYASSWHNCGFRVLAAVSARSGIRLSRIKFKGLYGKGRLSGIEVVLLMPTTFMNLSGESIGEAMRFFHIPAEHVIVIHDDVDFPVGTVRIRTTGGAGTHNGMKSVLAHVGNRYFPRIRIGVGPAPEHRDLADYVLSDIPESQRITMDTMFERAADAVELILAEGVERAMNRINAK